jgi:hypothetical protein
MEFFHEVYRAMESASAGDVAAFAEKLTQSTAGVREVDNKLVVPASSASK